MRMLGGVEGDKISSLMAEVQALSVSDARIHKIQARYLLSIQK